MSLTTESTPVRYVRSDTDEDPLHRYVNGAGDFVRYLEKLRGEKPRRVLEIVQEHPGINIDELAVELGIRRTAARHHVRRLERDRVIITMRQGRHLLHFPSAMNQIQRTATMLLRVPSVRGVAEALFRTPQVSWRDLAVQLDLSGRQVRRAIRILESKGLLKLETPSGQSRHRAHLHPEMRVVLARTVRELPVHVAATGITPLWVPAAAAAVSNVLDLFNP